MNREKLQELIRRPEGLKLDFKQEFYHIESKDKEARERQWGELIKDIVALTNGNVNIAGETGYIIIGVGDETTSGMRALFDVGEITIGNEQILDKVNSAISPPLPDIQIELELLGVKRILVITIPPSPHLHYTTRRLKTSSGRIYPENTVFIRRGSGTRTASMPEIQAISAEKERIFGKGASSSNINEIIEKGSNQNKALVDNLKIIFRPLVKIWIPLAVLIAVVALAKPFVERLVKDYMLSETPVVSTEETPEKTPDPTWISTESVQETETKLTTHKVTVEADAALDSTGIRIEEGDTFEVKYISGQWRSSPQDNWEHNLTCSSYDSCTDCLVTSVSEGGLIARIGNNKMFCVRNLPIISEYSGILFLGFNDNISLYYDNEGALDLEVMVTK